MLNRTILLCILYSNLFSIMFFNMIKECLFCGKEFEAKKEWASFCCIQHRTKYGYNRRKNNRQEVINVCKICGKEFSTKNNKNFFCSIKCRNTYSSNIGSKKRKETNLKLYGEEQFFKSNEFKKKSKQTMLLKYGVEYTMQSKEILDKAKSTCLEKYGKEFASQTDRFKNKVKQSFKKTCLNKYGVDNVSKLGSVKLKIKNTILNRYGVTTYLLSDNCPKPGVISKVNKEWAKWIEDNTGLKAEFEFKGIEGYSYDLKVGEYLIEIDPTWSHNSSKNNFRGKQPMCKTYHQNKSLAAEKEGYHCIHLFDRDKNDKVKNWLIGLLTKRKNLHNGKIMKVNNEDADVFYEKNHLQGKCSATVHYGIFVKGELINCMSFTKYKNERQLVRFASKMGYRIYCGASRLFKEFIKEHNPNKIISFSDITKHSGGLYNSLGFKTEKINPPSYWWVGNGNVYWRRKCQKQNMHRLEGFDGGYKYMDHKDDDYRKQTEKELMESKGYVIVYDSGMRKHVWKNTGKKE